MADDNSFTGNCPTCGQRYHGDLKASFEGEKMILADIVDLFPEEKIVGLVMALTGGSANPRTVRDQIDRIKSDEALKDG